MMYIKNSIETFILLILNPVNKEINQPEANTLSEWEKRVHYGQIKDVF